METQPADSGACPEDIESRNSFPGSEPHADRKRARAGSGSQPCTERLTAAGADDGPDAPRRPRKSCLRPSGMSSRLKLFRKRVSWRPQLAHEREYRTEASVVDVSHGHGDVPSTAATAKRGDCYRIWLNVEVGPRFDAWSDEDSDDSEEDEPPRTRPRRAHPAALFSAHAPPSAGPAFFFPAFQPIDGAADHLFTDDEVEVATFLAAAAEHSSAPSSAPCTFAIGV